ncbi:MAG: MFS transporter, partial [bacterium]
MAGEVFSQSADTLNQMTSIALITLVAPGSVMEIAKFLVAANLPAILIWPIAGVIADRSNRKKIMVVSNIIQAFLMTLILLLSHSLPHLLPFYIIIFLTYTSINFFQPALSASIPAVVPREQLLVANSLASGATMICLVIGAVLGNMLVARIGISRGFYINSLLYFIAAIMFFLIAGSIFRKGAEQNSAVKSPASDPGSIFRELAGGIKAILSDKFVHYA